MAKQYVANEARIQKGIAKQIGILKIRLQNLNRTSQTQFISGIVLGTLISITLNFLFKSLGL